MAVWQRGWARRYCGLAAVFGAIGFGLTGCGSSDSGPPLPSSGMPEAVSPTGLDGATAGLLESAAAGDRFRYRVGGAEVELVLGAKYESARGLSCRVGRLNGPAPAGSRDQLCLLPG